MGNYLFSFFFIPLSSLLSWIKAKDDELSRADNVGGLPERVQKQLEEVEVCVHACGRAGKQAGECECVCVCVCMRFLCYWSWFEPDIS